MWNYSFVVPNCCILAAFVWFYFSKPRISIRLNRSFLRLLIVEFSVIVLDVIASLCLDFHQRYSFFFLRLVNVLFFIAFFLRSFTFFLFTHDAVQLHFEKKTLLRIGLRLVFLFSALLALLNLRWNLLFSIDASGYSRAPFYNILYVNGFFYVFLSFLVAIYGQKNLPRDMFWSAITFNLVLFAGFCMRMLFPKHLLMDSICLLAIIICYFSFENPHRFIETRTGNFNIHALRAKLQEMEGEKASLIMGFSLHNYIELREIYSSIQMDGGIALIGKYLTKLRHRITPFYIGGGMFILIGRETENYEEVRDIIAARFKKPWNTFSDVDMMLEIGFARVSPELTIGNAETIFKGLTSALSSIEIVKENEVTVTEESISIIERNTEVKRAVERAVEKDSVELYLQPLVDAKNHKLIGAEALARIRDASGEIVPPGTFIPIAERNGRINILGEQMFEKACAFIKKYNIEEMGISWINVNLSPIQFLRYDLNERFNAILQKYDVSAEKIHLEITEATMVDYALLQKQIQQMKQTGFQFVLDDYGSGYSNVSRLKRCPFINVKLDMEIVWDYYKSRDKILPSLVETFHQMGFSVTAEGIETLDMAEEMKKIGCDYLQGYCFDRPLPAVEFAKKYGAH